MKTARITSKVFAVCLAAAVLGSAGWLLHPAFADDDDEALDDKSSEPGAPRTSLKGQQVRLSAAESAKRRQANLLALSTNENALINVAGAEVPASPDIINLGKKATKALARCVADNVDDGVRAHRRHFRIARVARRT
jgi:hypothetical protein